MIKAVLLDAMNTIFVPRDGKTRYDIIQDLIWERTGRTIAKEDIVRVQTQKRRELEDLPAENYQAKWVRINAAILAELGIPDENDAIAQEWNDRLLINPQIFEVLQETYSFLERMQIEGVNVIIASNNGSRALQKMVDAFALGPLLFRAYASEEIGHEKPSPEFFHGVLEHAGLTPDECVMIGNNPRNDMEGCQAAGVVGILYDPKNEYPDYQGYRIQSLDDLSFANL